MFIKSINVLFIIVVCCCFSSVVFCRPEPQLGVNFGGYHAEVGLGGLLGGLGGTGGGLFASAGTPYGQQAGAGLGGRLQRRGAAPARGGLFAVAETPSQYAGAGLGGRLGGGGGGNPAAGGNLFASAGTSSGQFAGAGLGGFLGGNDGLGGFLGAFAQNG